MADKRITDVDYISSLTSDESFFVNHNNSIKQINKSDVIFDIVNGGTGADNPSDARKNLELGSVAVEDILPVSKGGTGATSASKALTNLGITATASELNIMDGITATTAELNYCDGVTSNIQTQLNDKATSNHKHSASDINSGVLPLNKGGTGTSVDMNDAPPRSIIVKASEGYDQLYYTATKNGAFYATEENGAAKFGTLPIAQGGTGKTNGAAALNAFLAAGNTILSSYQYGDALPAHGNKGRIFLKKVNG